MIHRPTTSKIVAAKGGCERCASKWISLNSVALAAQHHDATGHPTWGEQTVHSEFGGSAAMARRKEPELL